MESEENKYIKDIINVSLKNKARVLEKSWKLTTIWESYQ